MLEVSNEGSFYNGSETISRISKGIKTQAIVTKVFLNSNHIFIHNLVCFQIKCEEIQNIHS